MASKGESIRPERYIVHPVRVMENCRKVTGSLPILAAALLHDVLEDTATSEHEINNFLVPLMGVEMAGITLDLVIELTDVYVTTNYPGLNRKERKAKEAQRMKLISADAQTIKYADILDNSREIATQDTGFAPIYLKEVAALLRVMTQGNQTLRDQAISLTTQGLKSCTNRRS